MGNETHRRAVSPVTTSPGHSKRKASTKKNGMRRTRCTTTPRSTKVIGTSTSTSNTMNYTTRITDLKPFTRTLVLVGRAASTLSSKSSSSLSSCTISLACSTKVSGVNFEPSQPMQSNQWSRSRQQGYRNSSSQASVEFARQTLLRSIKNGLSTITSPSQFATGPNGVIWVHPFSRSSFHLNCCSLDGS